MGGTTIILGAILSAVMIVMTLGTGAGTLLLGLGIGYWRRKQAMPSGCDAGA